MNRLDRITAILIQLQSKKVVKAQDIADRFDISLRTVYRDVKALEAGGIPIIGEAGIGYSIMDGYRLPPVMFTKEEATAFITAEKLVGRLTDKGTADKYKEAMYKVRSVLRSEEKGMVENIENVIQVYKYGKTDSPSYMYEILQSINNKKAVDIEYFANYNEQVSNRVVEPVGLYYIGNYWHLVAWCQLREDYRDFRLDRMRGLKNTDIDFSKDKISLDEYMEGYLSTNAMYKVVVAFNRRIVQFIQEQKIYFGFVSQEVKGNKVEMTFMTASLDYFARWMLSFGNDVEIIEPNELSTQIKELITGLSKHYFQKS